MYVRDLDLGSDDRRITGGSRSWLIFFHFSGWSPAGDRHNAGVSNPQDETLSRGAATKDGVCCA